MVIIILQFLLSLTSLGFFLAVLIGTEQKSLALLILLPSIFVFFAGAGLFNYRTRKRATQKKSSSQHSSFLVLLSIAPSAALILFCIVRLWAYQDHFHTRPELLDFGPKNGGLEPTNISFDGNGLTSFGHWIQGFLSSALLLLAMEGCLLLEPIALLLTFYPIYNFFKRWNLNGDTFATSSYFNNGTEWALGSLSGMAVGSFLAVVLRRRKTTIVDQHSRSSCENRSSMILQVAKCTSMIICCIMGILFWLSVIGACIMSWITWNNCFDEDDTTCVNYDNGNDPKPSVLVYLLSIPVLCCMIPIIAWVCDCNGKKQEKQEERIRHDPETQQQKVLENEST